MPAFSACRGISKSSPKSNKETLHDVKLQEHQISKETFQKSSDDGVEFSRTASGIDKSVGSTSNAPTQPRKGNKKKNKKRKYDKKHGNSNAPVPSFKLLDSTVKVVQGSKANDSLVHDELASKSNSRCSESILKTAGSEDVALTTSLGCLQRIDNTNFKPGREQRRGLASGALTSSTGCIVGSRTGCLEDASNGKSKSLIKPAYNDDLDLTGSSMVREVSDHKCTDVSWKQNEISSVGKTSNAIQDEATAESDNPAANQNEGEGVCATSLSIDCLSPHMVYSRIYLIGKETCTDGRPDAASSRSHSSNVNDEPPIASHENVHCQRLAQTQTTVDAFIRRCFTNNRKQLGKENSHYIWKKTKDIEVKQANSRIYNHELLRRNSCSRDMREFFTPDCTGRSRPHRHRREMSSHAQVQLESSQCLAHLSFHGRPQKYTTRTWGGFSAVRFTWKMSEDGLTQLFKQENADHASSYWVCRENLSKLQPRKYFADGEVSNIPRVDLYGPSTCSHTDIHDNNHRVSDSFDACKVQLAPSFLAHSSCLRSNGPWTRSSGHRNHLHEIRLHDGTKAPSSVGLSAGASQASIVVEDKAGVYPENGRSYDSTKVERTSSGVSSRKQVPLPTNYSSTCQTSKYMGVCMVTGNQETDFPIRIGSPRAVQVLDAAFRMQWTSDSFQSATKKPIAEFERLLHAISPIISHSFVRYNGGDSIGNQPTMILLDRSQYPNVLLLDVWSWYETFSCYGLKFKTGVSQRSECMVNEAAPCYAHFFPTLSAVQLFGHSQHSSSPVGASASYPLHSIYSDVPVQHSDEPKLTFQYFEDRRPRYRKPLYAQIEELLEFGASDTKVYGDPTKLGYSNLEDLHPASWFSVAWCPIYRIPQGNLKANFVTYHSFGHLVSRPIKLDLAKGKALYAFPALGMVTNQAKDEGWFHPTRSPESLSRGMPLDSSQIVADRLRTLNETAKLFARGEVLKDGAFVRNDQYDYRLFISEDYCP